MIVMSFNTQHCKNYLEQKIDFQIMADAILRCGADIVGLNEMYDEGEAEQYVAQTRILSELTGLKYYYFAKAIESRGRNPYGNAILSRYPIVHAETEVVVAPDYRPYPKNYETRCLLKAQLENGLMVLVTHFGLNPDEQQNMIDAVLHHKTDNKCILMGDFNAEPDDPVLQPLFENFFDTAKLLPAPMLTFPSDVPYKKIDYVLTTPDILVVSADVPQIIASDHRPYIAKLDL